MYLFGRPESALTSERDGWAPSGFAAVESSILALYSAIATASPVEYYATLYHRGSDTETPLTTAKARQPLAVIRKRKDERPTF
jgi:hypothetical protein